MKAHNIAGLAFVACLMVLAVVRVANPIMVYNTSNNTQITVDPLFAWNNAGNAKTAQNASILDRIAGNTAARNTAQPKYMAEWTRANEYNMAHFSTDNYLHLALLLFLGLGFIAIFKIFWAK